MRLGLLYPGHAAECGVNGYGRSAGPGRRAERIVEVRRMFGLPDYVVRVDDKATPSPPPAFAVDGSGSRVDGPLLRSRP